MQKTIVCAKCHETFEVVGSDDNSEATRDVTVSVACIECGSTNVLTWPDRAQYFVRRAD
jgi:hypothetical protein